MERPEARGKARQRGLDAFGCEARAWASAIDAMSRMAIQASVDGKNVDWMEKVSDAPYAK
jgi:hypothetical protein